MKMFIAALTLLAVQSASANTLNVRLVPCSTGIDSVCVKVYEDLTAAADFKGTEMTFVSDGETRLQITQLAPQVAGKILQVEGKTFGVFDGRTSRIQIDRIVRVVTPASYKQTSPYTMTAPKR